MTPNEDEKAFVDRKISEELELGVVTQNTLSTFCDIIHRMAAEDGIQAVVLGCTELPMLFKETELDVPYLDTMKTHIETLIDMVLRD